MLRTGVLHNIRYAVSPPPPIPAPEIGRSYRQLLSSLNEKRPKGNQKKKKKEREREKFSDTSDVQKLLPLGIKCADS
jgi:hypothetical protein